jgi:hypothetical protein
MTVHTGHKTQADGSSDCLSQLALVDGAQASHIPMLDTTHMSHVFRHHGEILQGKD